ncbi:hypothetical protein [Streptomyces sp. NPDC047000]|uniref:hypothetical protein n=1 Tax=Streptomyces sp. NPDC047000 TaxID=3155474 RepID=UPI0033C93B5F
MHTTRITATTVAAVTAALAVTLTGCSGITGGDKADSSKSTGTPTADTMVGAGSATKEYAIPTVPTGARRAELLRALAAANPDIVKYEEEAINAARSQCPALNGDGAKADRAAAKLFTYKDVTTTEAQGKQIDAALKDLDFCEA